MRRLPVPNIYGNLFSVAQKVVAITAPVRASDWRLPKVSPRPARMSCWSI